MRSSKVLLPQVPWRNTLAGFLREGRKSRDQSQAQLAKISGVSERRISQIEAQTLKGKPRAETLIKLALAVGADPRIWLSHAGYESLDSLIEGLRKHVAPPPAPGELKPFKEIEAEVERRIKYFQPAEILKNEIMEWVRVQLRQLDVSREISDSFRRELETRLSASARQTRADLKAYTDERVDHLDRRIDELRKLILDVASRVDRGSHIQSRSPHDPKLAG